MMTWPSRSSSEWWWVKCKGFFFLKPKDFFKTNFFSPVSWLEWTNHKCRRENCCIKKSIGTEEAETIANICWTQKIVAPLNQTQAALFRSTKCVMDKKKSPSVFPQHTLVYTQKASHPHCPSSPLLSDVHREAVEGEAWGHPVQAAVWGAAEQHQARCGVCDCSLWRALQEPKLHPATGDHPGRGQLYELWLT